MTTKTTVTERKRPPEKQLPAGSYIGKFRVIDFVGRGGMGSVYKVHDPDLDGVVAIKTLNDALASDESYVRRFLGEAKAASRVKNPNVVTIHALGTHEGLPYLVMEFV